MSMPGPTELIIILVIVALIFGTTKIKNIGSETKGATPEFILERVILKIDDNLETVFDFKSLKTDIKNNVNKIIDKLKGVQKGNSDKEKIDPKKIINNLKDLF